MDHNIIIGAVYVCVPAALVLAACLFATFCTFTPKAKEEASTMATLSIHEAAYNAYVRRYQCATVALTYWERVAAKAAPIESRAAAMMHVRTYKAEARMWAQKASAMLFKMAS